MLVVNEVCREYTCLFQKRKERQADRQSSAKRRREKEGEGRGMRDGEREDVKSVSSYARGQASAETVRSLLPLLFAVAVAAAGCCVRIYPHVLFGQ